MPKFISIAAEGPNRYIAIDSDGGVWRGQAATKREIKWEPVKSEFPRGASIRLTGGGLPQQDAMEDELEP